MSYFHINKVSSDESKLTNRQIEKRLYQFSQF